MTSEDTEFIKFTERETVGLTSYSYAYDSNCHIVLTEKRVITQPNGYKYLRVDKVFYTRRNSRKNFSNYDKQQYNALLANVGKEPVF